MRSKHETYSARDDAADFGFGWTPALQDGGRTTKSGIEQTVVIIDDDPFVAEAIAFGLVHDGRRIIVCRAVESATVLLEREKVDAIVADVAFGQEPPFDGFAPVDRLIRSNPGVPVFLMTADVRGGLEIEAVRRGASAMFRKPFSVFELDEMLREPEGVVCSTWKRDHESNPDFDRGCGDGLAPTSIGVHDDQSKVGLK